VRAAGGVLIALFAFAAAGQAVVPERELEIVKQNFNVGNYKEALSRAVSAMEVSNFNDAQRAELHKFAGLSAFNLGDVHAAEKHFLALLQLNPDYVLDPFAYPPPSIRLFEEVKKNNAAMLNLVRQQIALREEQARREFAEKEKAKALADEQRRRLEEQGKQATVKTIEKRSFLVNFVPFGAGQFQQGRNGLGATFAAAEAALGLTSLVAYIVIGRLFEDVTYTWNDRLTPDGTFSVTVRRIPEALRNSAYAWTVTKLVSGGGFYLAWAIGVFEALWHHKDEVVTTEIKRLDETTPLTTPPKSDAPRLFVFPTNGGFGAGLTLRF
jgi:tetratricopeptide (TPR) repeat protein